MTFDESKIRKDDPTSVFSDNIINQEDPSGTSEMVQENRRLQLQNKKEEKRVDEGAFISLL